MFIIFYIIFFIFLFRFLIIYLNKDVRNYFSICPINDSSLYFYYSDFYRYKKLNEYDSRNLLSSNPVRLRLWYSWFFSKIIKRNILFKFSFLPNLIIFYISIVFYSISLYFLNYSFKEIYLILILLIILPENFLLRMWNINFFSFSPRLLVLIFNSFYWFILLKFNIDNLILSNLILVILGIANLSLSNFSRQSFIFTNILFSFFSYKCFLIFTISLILFISYAPSKNLLLLKNQFIGFKWQFNRLHKNKLFYWPTIKENIYSPLLIIFLFILCDDTNLRFFICIILLIYFITSLSYFSFIGENWRYISVNYIFLAPIIIFDKLLITVDYTESVILLISVALLALSYSLNLNIKGFDKQVEIVKDIENIIKDKKSLKKANWYSAPYLVSIYPMNFSYGNATLMFNKGEFDRSEIPANTFPFIPLDLELIKKYKLTHVLILKSKIKEISSKKIINSNVKLNLIDQNKSIQLFKIINV